MHTVTYLTFLIRLYFRQPRLYEWKRYHSSHPDYAQVITGICDRTVRCCMYLRAGVSICISAMNMQVK
jgi:hypothetical protein